MVGDAADAREWIGAVLEHGSGRNDAIALRASHAAVVDDRPEELAVVNELVLALAAGAERHRESVQLGASFRRAASAWLSDADPLAAVGEPCALPVAVGALSAHAALPALPVLAASLQANAANLVWIAARLVPLGQSDALAVIAALETSIERLAGEAHGSTLDDLGGCAVLADIASLRHERLRSRVCRT